ncbi:hypothetical protein GC170_21030 [bacterium]|nr:hypothetical protein [bacterium]
MVRDSSDQEHLEKFRQLRNFLELSDSEIQAVHEISERLEPVLNRLIEDVYEHLTEQDCTLRHFARPQNSYTGPVPKTIEEITPDHPLMKFRKQATLRYLISLISRPLNEPFIQYLNWVGMIHHAKAGATRFTVPVVQLEALMGFIMPRLTAGIGELKLSRHREEKVMRGLQKLLWIQNEFILMHYHGSIPSEDSGKARHDLG